MVAFPQEGEQFGRYLIERVLGQGGMGVVYQAKDPALRRKVALKLVLPSLTVDKDFITRFEREANILAKLRSRNIVQIIEYGEVEGTVYLVTEYVPDGDLHGWLKTKGPLETVQALRLVGDVSDALSDAHRAGVVHRDVKPSNVLLWERQEGELVPYLTDFGIATEGDSNVTRAGSVVGSLPYMSPERHMGEQATASGDIYAAGCLLWACLTGKAPYTGSDFELMSAHINSPVPWLPASTPGADLINPIIQRALAKKPENRYQTAADLARALYRAAGMAEDVGIGSPVEPSPGNVGTGDHNPRIEHPGPQSVAVEVFEHAELISDQPSREDLLDFRRYVEPLARLIAGKTTTPPLTVALLAEWGAGKSSFMWQLRDELTRLVSDARDSNDSPWVQGLGVVTFNAWHYNDDHAILGMVNEVFRSLKELLEIPMEPPSETSDEFGASRDEKTALREEIDRLSGVLGRLTMWRAATLLPKYIWEPGGRWGARWARLSVIVAVATGVALLGFATQLLDFLPSRMSGLAIATASALVVVAGSLVPAWRKISKALEAIHSQTGRPITPKAFVEESLKQEKARLASRMQEIEVEEENIRRAESRTPMGRARSALKSLSETVADPKLAAIRADYYGVVGLLQEQLRALSDALDSHYKEDMSDLASRLGPRTYRIVLHVDDLDRCTPERVFEVLQAVALLQATDLFVVVVSVDPRWLRRSLEHHDHATFSSSHGDRVRENISEHIGDPLDYLDKIFQVPFSLPRMSHSAGEAYMREMVADSRLARVVSSGTVDIDDSMSVPTVVKPHVFVDALQVDSHDDDDAHPTSTRRVEATRGRHEESDVTEYRPGRLWQHEVDALVIATKVMSTPRGIKKLLNLYQLIRLDATNPRDDSFAKEGGGYRAAILSLSLIVGAPFQMARFFARAEVEPEDSLLIHVVESAVLEHRESTQPGVRASLDAVAHGRCSECRVWDRVYDVVKASIEAGAPEAIEEYKPWFREVSRFSFHTENISARR